MTSAEQALAGARIEESVRAAHPDYVATLIVVSGLEPGPTTEVSDALLTRAESFARELLAGREAHDLPRIHVWREAFLHFGVKPREARSSVDALLRRAGSGLPRIDRLTDTYNAISVLHLLPVGGEDLDGYVGAPRLVTAAGDESFDTVADGEPVVQLASAGEIAWRDDAGITCRRWNWRQCVRTRLTTSTTNALFILDGLGADAQQRNDVAATELISLLQVESPSADFHSRTLSE